jgi:hypothetical protein
VPSSQTAATSHGNAGNRLIRIAAPDRQVAWGVKTMESVMPENLIVLKWD